MSTKIVNTNVNYSVKMWEQALLDAEDGLRNASRELASWKQTTQIIRKKIADGAPWPGSSQPYATRN